MPYRAQIGSIPDETAPRGLAIGGVEPHDRAVLKGSSHLKRIGQAWCVNHKRVIARRQKILGQSCKEAFVLVLDGAHFAVHNL